MEIINTAFLAANNVENEIDGLTDVKQLISGTIIPIILWSIAVIGVIIVIAIGFQFMTQQQAEERQKLKSRLIWFAIGTGIVFASATIWQILQSIFQIG